eukprot:TRINITY_DN2_c0_g1_i1.p1 TRINITY_DN2_c0_g1~~TRINITY_DN2_c0_g1_i1.p1  ORF type:complete len:475 (+),score=124.34 TRINITY_DN2_c0_g1_i1:67-1491(+)
MSGTPSEHVFIGDLPADITDHTLQTVLGAYGTIQSFKILPPGNRGTGNAVVTFATLDEAKWVVENLNGNIPQGLSSVIQARYKDTSYKGKGKDKGGKGGDAPWSGGKGSDTPATPSEHLFIGDLPRDIDENRLKAVFGPYGTVQSAKIVKGGGANGLPAAVMTFGTLSEAQWIVDNLNGNIPQGLAEPIQVRFKQQSRKGKGDGYGDWNSWQGDWQEGWKGGASSVAPPAPSVPSESVFVGDLPVDMTDQRLRQVFDAYGTISSHKMVPPGQGGKAAAIITFATTDQAKWLVDNLNGNIPQGLSEPIKVRFKEQKGAGKGSGYQERSAPYDSGKGYEKGKGGYDGGKGKYDGGKGYDYGWESGASGCSIKMLVEGLFASGAMPGEKKQNSENTLFVGGLPYDTTDGDMYKLFSPFGAIEAFGVRAMPGDMNPCRGFGFVSFQDSTAAQVAINTLNGKTTPDGKELKVSIKKAGQ